jgi:threonine/homoserine/homoserine lactone efflux protein
VSLDLYLAFVLTSAVVLAIPGPTILYVTGCALSHGRRSIWATAPGVALGDLLAMSCALLGMGALLTASAELFTLLKWGGAAYLIWLGLKSWQASPAAPATRACTPRQSRTLFAQAFVITALNPKSIAFFVAFLPQFVRHGEPLGPQFALLVPTFVVLAVVNATLYGLLAGAVRERARDPRTMRALNRVGGGALIGAGLMTALMRRPA